MPHTGSPPCSSGDGIRRAEKDTEPLILCPGLNGALSPASPPGFVTALTTARSRDVPAECFDERLPRRLPHRGSPGACIYSPPASYDDPIELTGRLPRSCSSADHLLIFSGSRPLTVTDAPRKRNPAP